MLGRLPGDSICDLSSNPIWRSCNLAFEFGSRFHSPSPKSFVVFFHQWLSDIRDVHGCVRGSPFRAVKPTSWNYLDLFKAVGKNKKYSPNGGLMVIYYGKNP